MSQEFFSVSLLPRAGGALPGSVLGWVVQAALRCLRAEGHAPPTPSVWRHLRTGRRFRGADGEGVAGCSAASSVPVLGRGALRRDHPSPCTQETESPPRLFLGLPGITMFCFSRLSVAFRTCSRGRETPRGFPSLAKGR